MVKTHKIQEDSIDEIYRRCGLMRKSDLFALKEKGMLKAAILVDQSDLGINMSELLNCIKVFVVDETLSWAVLQQAVNTLGVVYHSGTIPVLIFPVAYLKQQGVAYRKIYRLWVLDTHLDGYYIDVVRERIKIKKIKFLAKYIRHSIAKFVNRLGSHI